MGRPELIKTPLGQRLRDIRKARGDPDRDEFAQLLGFSKSSMAHYERGDTIPDARVLKSYLDKCGVSAGWLLSGEGEMFGSAVPAGSTFVAVPRLDVSASAGTGALAVNEETVGVLAFDAQWLRKRGINPNFANALTARGDSMEPTIRDGDTLLVDRSIDKVADNGIYVAVVGGYVVVKRIHIRRDGAVVLKSDNQLYDPETFEPGETDELIIAGRVMWFGRSI